MQTKCGAGHEAEGQQVRSWLGHCAAAAAHCRLLRLPHAGLCGPARLLGGCMQTATGHRAEGRGRPKGGGGGPGHVALQGRAPVRVGRRRPCGRRCHRLRGSQRILGRRLLALPAQQLLQRVLAQQGGSGIHQGRALRQRAEAARTLFACLFVGDLPVAKPGAPRPASAAGMHAQRPQGQAAAMHAAPAAVLPARPAATRPPRPPARRHPPASPGPGTSPAAPAAPCRLPARPACAS